MLKLSHSFDSRSVLVSKTRKTKSSQDHRNDGPKAYTENSSNSIGQGKLLKHLYLFSFGNKQTNSERETNRSKVIAFCECNKRPLASNKTMSVSVFMMASTESNRIECNIYESGTVRWVCSLWMMSIPGTHHQPFERQTLVIKFIHSGVGGPALRGDTHPDVTSWFSFFLCAIRNVWTSTRLVDLIIIGRMQLFKASSWCWWLWMRTHTRTHTYTHTHTHSLSGVLHIFYDAK